MSMNYYSPKELAIKVGVNRETVKRWIQSGKLKATKVGYNLTRITEEDFLSFMEARKYKNVAPIAEENHTTLIDNLTK